jgi:GxxExxY protein
MMTSVILNDAHDARAHADALGRFGDASDAIIDACIEVHRRLGPGLAQAAYVESLAHELALRGVEHQRNYPLAIHYKGKQIASGFTADLIVAKTFLVDVKTVDRLLPIHETQVATYLRLARIETAVLVNFNVRAIKSGIRRVTRKVLAAPR